MYICLSSGAIPRYRQDILRAVAMPEGTILQFRYELRWIAPKVKQHFPINKWEAPAIVAYVDQHDKNVLPEIVPCRMAKISNVTEHGTTASLQLSLQEFCFAKNISAFNAEIRDSRNSLPEWVNGKPAGYYWSELITESHTIEKSTDLGLWERIVSELFTHQDYSQEKYFYTVESICQTGKNIPIKIENEYFNFLPSKEYELRIYHYSPNSTPNLWLQVTTPNSQIEFTTNCRLSLDSRYDLKRVRMKTGEPTKTTQTVISINRILDERDSAGVWEFDLPVKIKTYYWKIIARGSAVGFSLAIPQLIAYLSNKNADRSYADLIIFAILFFNLLAGIYAAFNFRKSI